MDPQKPGQGGQKQQDERRRDQSGQPQHPSDKPAERRPDQPGQYPGDKTRQGK